MIWHVAMHLLGAGQSLVLPGFVMWLLVRYFLDMSPIYFFKMVYLELSLAVLQYSPWLSGDKVAAVTSEGKAKAASKAGSVIQLRGVQVVSQSEYVANGQTLPPSKRVSQIFEADGMPEGELCLCETPKSRSRGLPFHFGRPPREEVALGTVEDEAWLHRRQCLREGAEVHRQVRQAVQRKVRPGMETREVVEMVESTASTLVGFDPETPLSRGWAFPTGLSLNEVAAHDTVNPGDARRSLLSTDLAKLDFGVHIQGHILDCAFSFAFDPMHDELMEAVREATNRGIRCAGPDAIVGEVGAEVQAYGSI
jgi:methionyl aminopeptidase